MTTPEFSPPKCVNCGATLVKIKDKEYYACPNWKPGAQGCEGDIYDPRRKNKGGPNVAFTNKVESKSNQGHYYIVKLYESGDMDCPCYAGNTGKFCRHKKIMVTKMSEVMKLVKEKYLKPNK